LIAVVARVFDGKAKVRLPVASWQIIMSRKAGAPKPRVKVDEVTLPVRVILATAPLIVLIVGVALYVTTCETL
jgi:hypothetical protein